jgi:hypothetical protein
MANVEAGGYKRPWFPVGGIAEGICRMTVRIIASPRVNKTCCIAGAKTDRHLCYEVTDYRREKRRSDGSKRLP